MKNERERTNNEKERTKIHERGGNTKYPKIQTIAKTPNLTEFLNFFRFSRFWGSFSFFHFLLALPRSSSLFLALPRSCSLLLARSCSLLLALPRSSSLFLALPWSCCVVFFLFLAPFCSFSFWGVCFCFVLLIFCVFLYFLHVFSLCLVFFFCRFVCPV